MREERMITLLWVEAPHHGLVLCPLQFLTLQMLGEFLHDSDKERKRKCNFSSGEIHSLNIFRIYSFIQNIYNLFYILMLNNLKFYSKTTDT